MDADGEDDPNKIITINRTKRNEKFIFRFMYVIHYLFTLLITGKKIRFGNYSVISSDKLKKLFSSGNLWGAYSAAIINNYTDIKPLFYERKKTYTDETKMNLFKLIFHSLRIISIFKKKVYFFSTIYIIFLILINLFYNNKIFFIF